MELQKEQVVIHYNRDKCMDNLHDKLNFNIFKEKWPQYRGPLLLFLPHPKSTKNVQNTLFGRFQAPMLYQGGLI